MLTVARPTSAEPTQPADLLLRLVPPDAAVVLTVEGLRDRAREFAGSRLAAELRQLPAVRAWLDSEKFRQFERARAGIEAQLATTMSELRDELVGDAVVLVLWLGPKAQFEPNQARGLLLLRARDPALLQRLLRVVNASQQASGELARVLELRRGDTIYYVREFPPTAQRPREWYVDYPDGTFAFSNSETLIQAVIDRKGRTTLSKGEDHAGGAPDHGIDSSLGGLPKLQAVHRRLPKPALARLFVDPRPLRGLLASASRSSQPKDVRFMAMMERYLTAVEYAGAALVCRDGILAIHEVETFDPSRLDAWLRRWAGDGRRLDPALGRVPPTAVILASMHLDASALHNAVLQAVPEEKQSRIANIDIILTGLLLGQDLVDRILPCLGPGVVGYLDAPDETAAGSEASTGRGGMFPLVMVVSLGSGSGTITAKAREPEQAGITEPPAGIVADALENALRTILALMASDEKQGRAGSRITTRQVGGAVVATLDVPIPFAYAVDRAGGRLVLGTSASAVARYLECASDPEAGARFRRFRAAAFPGVETYLCIDLDALSRLAGRYRDRLATTLAARQKRPLADVQGDLEHLLALARLFEAAYLTSHFEPDGSAVQRTAGLILRRENSPPLSQP
jgi:hypothetical protein